MVEDIDYFFKYPWGKLSFKKVSKGVQKDMKKQLKHYEEKKKEGSSKKQKEAKYSFNCYAPALLYWAFEAMPSLGSKFGENSGNQIPRMLSWATKTNITISIALLVPIFANRRLVVFPMLKPRPSEVVYYNSLPEVDSRLFPELESTVGEAGTAAEEIVVPEKEAEKLAKVAKEASIFYEDVPRVEEGTSQACAASSSQVVQTDYEQLMQRLKRVVEGQATLLQNQTTIMAQLAQLLSLVSGRSTDVKSDTESDILPANYKRGDQPSTPQAHTSVVASDADSPSVRVLQPEEAAGLEVVRKKRRPKRFDDFTDPTKKIRLDK
ncbi:uncharacterized protein LOC133816146 [Humulus lupulus]|uniref:uncharacterized protein LOC133816146 n=1 Tax=Humulus lupulus TaxID=3486 RepID=UPI002B4153A9|nr:uncharacterized protein LOC133816146 [Humulus lupulus]